MQQQEEAGAVYEHKRHAKAVPCIIPLHIMAFVNCDFGSVSLRRQSSKKGKFKETDGQKVALYVGIIKWI